MAEKPTSAPSSIPDRLTDIVTRAELQVNNPRFGEELREELKQMKLTEEELTELQSRFEQSKMFDRLKNDARTIILERMKEDRQAFMKTLNPLTWTPENQRTALVTVGGVAVGGALLLWAANRFAKASEGARASARRIRNGVMIGVGLLAAGVATFVGIEVWKNWGEIHKQIGYVLNLGERIKKTTGETQEALKRELAEAEATLARMKEEAARAKEAARAAKEPALKPAEDEKKDKAPEPETKPALPSAQEIEKLKLEGERAMERAALELTGTGLLTMYSMRAKEAGITQEAERNAVRVLLNDSAVQKLTVDQLQNVRTPENAAALLPPSATDAEKKGLLFLALVIRDLEPRIREGITLGYEESFGSVSLKTCIDSIHHAPKMFQRLQGALKGKSWSDVQNFPEVIAEAFADDSLGDIRNDPRMMTRLEALGLKGHEAEFFGECLKNGRSTLLTHITPEGEHPEVQKALIAIREDLLSTGSIAYLKEYLHGRTDLPFAEKFEEHLRNNLTVVDAVQLYMYLYLARKEGAPADLPSSSPIGALLTQMKVLDLLGKTDKDLATHMKAHLVIELPKNAGNVKLPEGARDFLLKIFTQAGSATLNFGQDKLQQAWNLFAIHASEFYKSYPKEVQTGMPLLLTTGASLIGIRQYRVWQMSMADRLADVLAGTREQSWFRSLFNVTEARSDAFSVSKTHDLADAVIDAQKQIARVAGTDAALAKALDKEYQALFSRKFTTTSFDEFYNRLNALRAAGYPSNLIDDVERTVRDTLQPFRKTFEIRRSAFLWERSARALGVAAQGYALYEDAKGIGTAWEQERTMRQHAQNVMQDIEKQLTPEKGFTPVPGKEGTFIHRNSGVEVCLKEVRAQIEEGDEGLKSKTMAQYLRTGTSAASLAATVYMGAKVFTGPVGLVMLGVEVGVRTGINTWEEGSLRSFLRDAPPWLIATLGTAETTGISEGDWLNKSSSWMMSDVLQGSADKKENRKKMLFAILCHDLQRYTPELFADITQGLDTPPLLDALYTKDFQQFILPAFYVQLFAQAPDNSSWNQLSQGDTHISEDGWQTLNPLNFAQSLVIPPDVTMVQIRTAMRDASVLYSQHVRERRYLSLLKERSDVPADSASHDPLLEGLIAEMGREKVWGIPLSAYTQDLIATNNGKTRAERILEQLSSSLHTTKGDTKAEKRSNNPGLFTVNSKTVSGLPAALETDNRAELIALVEDPVLREQLSRVFAATTGEREGAGIPGFIEWQNTKAWKVWLELPAGVDRNAGAHTMRIAANTVRKAAGAPPVAPNASFDAASNELTEAAIAYMNERRGSLARNANLETSLYTGSVHPLVFSSLDPLRTKNADNQQKLCRQLRSPNTSQQEFSEDNLLAVFFEGTTMEQSGHDVVVATYVFNGDSKEPYRIVQQGASTMATANGEGLISGMAMAMNLAEFGMQKGAKDMIAQLGRGIAQRTAEKAAQAAEGKKAEAQEQNAWASAKPERDALASRNEQVRAAALEQAKIPGRMVYVPGAYERDEQAHVFRQKPATFRGTIQGREVTITIPQDPDQTSIGAALDRSALRTPTDREKFHFSAVVNGKKYNYAVDVESLRSSKVLTDEDRLIARQALTTPLDLTGHPRAGDEAFVEQIRKHELNRMLDSATYEKSFLGSTAVEYRRDLFNAIWPYYKQAQHKEIFLNTLLNNLLAEKTVTRGSYQRIVRNMQHST